MKKAQIEMVGLVVLVILIVISLVFLLRFISSDKQDLGSDIKLMTQANNLQSSLLITSICENNDLENAFINCCSNTPVCGVDSCKFLKDEVPGMIEGVLPKQKYKLSFKQLNKECFTLDYCAKDASLIGPGYFPIKKQGQSYSLQILLC